MAIEVDRDVGLFTLSIDTSSDYIFDVPLWNPVLLGQFQGTVEVKSELLHTNFVLEIIDIREERLELILGFLGVTYCLSQNLEISLRSLTIRNLGFNI